MKQVIHIFSFFGLLLFISIVAVNAQTSKQVNADIPFEFRFDDKTFDAGRYILGVKPDLGNNKAKLTLNDKNGKPISSFIVDRLGTPRSGEKAGLFFDHQKGSHTLRSVIIDGAGYGAASSTSFDWYNVEFNPKPNQLLPSKL